MPSTKKSKSKESKPITKSKPRKQSVANKETTKAIGARTKRRSNRTKKNIITNDSKSNGENTESEDKSCNMEHADYAEICDDEWNRDYFKPKAVLFGAKCRLCQIEFVHKPNDKYIAPKVSHPTWICIRRNSFVP